MIIAVDGAAGTGKSTVARLVAERLDFLLLDTGALYRAIAWRCREEGLAPSKPPPEELLTTLHLEIIPSESGPRYLVRGRDVSTEIRTAEISQMASLVSVHRSVRQHVMEIERDLAQGKNVVIEGRDTGSVVFPDAEHKFFLTASPRVRAERRWAELKAKFPEKASMALEEVEREIAVRDLRDETRELAPLICPEGAIQIDTSSLTIDEVVARIIAHVRTVRLPNRFYRNVCKMMGWFFRTFYHHQVFGLENIPDGPTIFAANHTSFFDPPIAASSCPEEIHFLARGTLFRYRWFARLLRDMNAHPVRGGVGDFAVFKLIFDLLQQGKKVLLFPEGTRSATGELGPLKSGIALLAARSEAPVVPIYIDAMKAWRRGRFLPRFCGRTSCTFGKPLFWSQFAHLEKKEAGEAFLSALRDAILALKKKRTEPPTG